MDHTHTRTNNFFHKNHGYWNCLWLFYSSLFLFADFMNMWSHFSCLDCGPHKHQVCLIQPQISSLERSKAMKVKRRVSASASSIFIRWWMEMHFFHSLFLLQLRTTDSDLCKNWQSKIVNWHLTKDSIFFGLISQNMVNIGTQRS